MANIKKELRSIDALDSEAKNKAILELIQKSDVKQMKAITPYIKEDDTELIEMAVNVLTNFLDSEKPSICKSAIKLISHFKTLSAIDALIKTLSSSNKYIRHYAAKALGGYCDQSAFKPLINALSDEYLKVRVAAARALGNLGNHDAVIPLTELLDDDVNVVPSVAQALGKLKDKRALQPLVDAHRTYNVSNEHIVNAIGDIGAKEYISTLGEWLKDCKIPGEKDAIQTALAKTKDPRAVPFIFSCLGGTYPDWEHTINALGQTQCIEAASPILDGSIYTSFPQTWTSHGGRNEIYTKAVNALLMLPQAEVLAILIKHFVKLKQEKQNLFILVFYDFSEMFIEKITDPAAKNLLVSLLNYDKRKIRNAAKRAIEKIDL